MYGLTGGSSDAIMTCDSKVSNAIATCAVDSGTSASIIVAQRSLGTDMSLDLLIDSSIHLYLSDKAPDPALRASLSSAKNRPDIARP